MFTQEEKKFLLSLARKTLTDYLNNITTQKPKNVPEPLKGKYGAFVTLHTKDGELRGCIGYMQSNNPLYETIMDLVISSATSDPRFPPMSKEELDNVIIEISVLSPLRKVSSYKEIELGKHGVLVRKGYQSGVFLPQVAKETGWSKEEFLSNLCEYKAGLPRDAWKSKDVEVFVFTAEVFHEE
jgi:AmmeMemoRadiSam system protein A